MDEWVPGESGAMSRVFSPVRSSASALISRSVEQNAGLARRGGQSFDRCWVYSLYRTLARHSRKDLAAR